MTEFKWICLPVRLSGRRVVDTCRIKGESEDAYHLQGEMRVVPAWGRGELQKSCATTHSHSCGERGISGPWHSVPA